MESTAYKNAIKDIENCIKNGWPFLDLSYYNLDSVPEQIKKATHITELNLSNNNLYNLPEFIYDLEKLKSIDLSNNNLNEVRGLSIKYNSNIQLDYINLDNNLFEEIPYDILKLNHYPSISMYNNPCINKMPPEIYEYGFESVVRYLEELKKNQNSIRVLEAKLIFVGRGDVGKTSLMRKLLNDNYNLNIGEEKTTHGINIKQWQLPFTIETLEEYPHLKYTNLEKEYWPDDITFDYSLSYDEDMLYSGIIESFFGHVEREVNINIWDFGGQDIYLSTHQFFLTKRSIYVLVWEARKEEQYDYFEYWLNTIKLLGDQSKVLIVMNKSDVRTTSIDTESLQNKYSNIIGFYEVSCLTNSGIEEFKEELTDAILNLPHLKDLIPKSWMNLKEQLLNLDDNYISFSRFKELCSENSIHSDHLINLFSDYLHDIGIIIRYRKDPILEDLVVIKPSWLTKAVYQLIDSEKIIKSNGKFSLNDLKDEWNKDVYPVDKYLLLLRLMEQFELCFNLIDTSNYVLPQLLPQSIQRDLSKMIQKDASLNFQYSYNFMPNGIITRFICRIHNWIYDNIYWFNGVVITYEGAKGMITQDRIKKNIYISIEGEDKSNLLAIVREHFDLIHNSMNLRKIKDYKEIIPCNCEECIRSENPFLFEINVLKKFKNKNKDYIDCQSSAETVNIDKLLTGYNLKNRLNLIDHIIIACSQLQGMKKIIGKNEDDRNGIVANILNNRGIISKDQSKWGQSESSKNQGELDIKIEDKEGRNIGIFEGLNLDSLNKFNIEKHLLKTFKYDSNGLPQNFIIIYSNSTNFLKLWGKYLYYINEIKYDYPLIEESKDISKNLNDNAEIKIGITVHKRQGINVKLYHIFVNMN